MQKHTGRERIRKENNRSEDFDQEVKQMNELEHIIAASLASNTIMQMEKEINKMHELDGSIELMCEQEVRKLNDTIEMMEC